MKEEIFIKGEAVELGDVSITLNFKSNLFGDISKITASNSYTINLPKTAKNTRLLDFPDVPAHKSYMMRDYFDCSYYRNGIKIFKGKAVLTGATSDAFNIALTWGIDERIIELINSDKEISDFINTLSIRWDSSSIYDYGILDNNPTHGYIPMWTGIDVDANRDKAFVHPSLSVYSILEEIGINYDLWVMRDFWQNKTDVDLLYIPLVAQMEGGNNHFYADVFLKGGGIWGYTEVASISSVYLQNGELYIGDDSKVYNIGYTVKVERSDDFIPELSIFDNNGTWLAGKDATLTQSGEYIVSVDFDPSQYAGEAPFKVVGYGGFNMTNVSGSLLISQISDNYSELQYKDNSYYDLRANAPQIKVIDFIKQICWMYGLFAVVSPVDGKLRFVRFEEVLSNKSDAVDWSFKIIPSGHTPAETAYKFGDFAQTNWMRYKENEDSIQSADGSFAINDKTLEKEKDLLTLPFKAGGDDGRFDAVPYFEFDDDEVKAVDCGDRIMRLTIDNIGDYPYLSFKGLDFKTIIEKYYQEYIALVGNPFVIKDKFRLSELDLKNLDYTIPVYIGRYGAYFAIISIQVQGEVSTCELLKL